MMFSKTTIPKTLAENSKRDSSTKEFHPASRGLSRPGLVIKQPLSLTRHSVHYRNATLLAFRAPYRPRSHSPHRPRPHPEAAPDAHAMRASNHCMSCEPRRPDNRFEAKIPVTECQRRASVVVLGKFGGPSPSPPLERSHRWLTVPIEHAKPEVERESSASLVVP
jgi:hypothetical protein